MASSGHHCEERLGQTCPNFPSCSSLLLCFSPPSFRGSYLGSAQVQVRRKFASQSRICFPVRRWAWAWTWTWQSRGQLQSCEIGELRSPHQPIIEPSNHSCCSQPSAKPRGLEPLGSTACVGSEFPDAPLNPQRLPRFRCLILQSSGHRHDPRAPSRPRLITHYSTPLLHTFL
jgi:hypothetical protein